MLKILGFWLKSINDSKILKILYQQNFFNPTFNLSIKYHFLYNLETIVYYEEFL